MPLPREMVLAMRDECRRTLAYGRAEDCAADCALAAELAEHLPDGSLVAELIELEADALRRAGRYDEATDELWYAFAIAGSSGDDVRSLRIGCRIAVLYARRGLAGYALACAEHVERRFLSSLPPDHRSRRYRRLLQRVGVTRNPCTDARGHQNGCSPSIGST